MQEEVHQQIRTDWRDVIRWHGRVVILVVLSGRRYVVNLVNIY